jgi:spore maturation protein CgeB
MKHDYGDIKRPKSYEYIHILESLISGGYDCEFFDYMDYGKKFGHEALQKKLIKLSDEVLPSLVIFSLYLDQIHVETIKDISSKYKTLGIFLDDTWRRDFVVKYGGAMHFFTTTDIFGEAIYRKMGLSAQALYLSYGYNPKYFYPDRTQFIHDISFVGSWSSTRQWIYNELKKSGFKVVMYGYGWENGVVNHEEMLKLFQQSKISLNLSNSVQDNFSYIFSSLRALKNYFSGSKKGEQLKGRHTEINASGGFQISFYADGLASLYELHSEIEVYQSIDDLKFKLKFYLEYEEERERVAAQGLLRSRDYEYLNVLEKLFHRMGLS